MILTCYELIDVFCSIDAKSEADAARICLAKLRRGNRDHVRDSERGCGDSDRPDWKEFRVESVMR